MVKLANEAMVIALKKRSPEGVVAALNAGADVNYEPGFKTGGGILLAAIATKQERVVKLLLAAGADANNAPRLSAGDKVDLHLTPPTPLTVAVSKDSPRIVKLLVNAGADANSTGVLAAANDCWPQRVPEDVARSWGRGEHTVFSLAG